MSILFFNTKHFGQIIGEATETIEGDFHIAKAAYVQMQQNPQTGEIGSAMMAVMTAFVEDDVLILNKDDVIGGVGYKPSTDIYNQYQSRFGSGIQLTTSPLVK